MNSSWKRANAKSVPVGAEVLVSACNLLGTVKAKRSTDSEGHSILILENARVIHDRAGNGHELVELVHLAQTVEVQLVNQRVRYRGLSEEARNELLCVTDDELKRILALREERKGNRQGEIAGPSS